ncbi:methylmalonyl Co-A mutase-associated GTPase MeaB [Thermodesulfobacteriota bacterium]
MTDQDLTYYIQGVRENNRRILAKTITLIESSLPSHQDMARQIIDQLLPYSGNAVRLGISGVPGVGKSTFIETLGMMLIEKGHRVAVLAVDPSSVKSGGSVMADKTRMEKLSVQESAFIRPSPSKGSLGGVARKTRETMLICESAGFDVLIVETVGVGQSETTVASMVDFFLLLMLAGAGDEFQGIKKGILEIADAIVVNKADGDNREKADQAKKMFEAVLHLFVPTSATWTPVVLTSSSVESRGIEDIWQAVLQHRDRLSQTGELKARRQQQALDWMWSLVDEGIKARFDNHSEIRQVLSGLTDQVENGTTTPTSAAERLLSLLDQ